MRWRTTRRDMISSSATSANSVSSASSTRSTRSNPRLSPDAKRVGATRPRVTPTFFAIHCRPVSTHLRCGAFCSAISRAALCAAISA
eukprot:scaffold70426_cov108-Phaeocystis_antarctica.AAC.3